MNEEPVEIELRLDQNIDIEGLKAAEALDSITEASERSKAVMQANIKEQKKTVSDLATEINKLHKIAGEPNFKADPAFTTDLETKTKLLQQLENKLESTEKEYAQFIAMQKAAAASTAATNAQVGGYTKQMGGLNLSIQQVARELPNLAISPQLFIMAISNNLPILQDELRKTRLANEALKKSGQTTVPVWKQIIKSIFSWQTALVAGITILTVFGKDIFEAVGNLLSFGDAAKLTRKEIKALTDSLAENAGAELGKMNRLFDRLKDAEKGTTDYYNAKRDIIKQYGSYLQGLDAEIIALNDVNGAYQAISKSLFDLAKEKSIDELYKEQFTKVQKTINEQLPIIQKSLTESLGETNLGELVGQQYYQRIINESTSGKGLSYEMQRVVDSFDKEITRFYDRMENGVRVQGYETVTLNPVKDAIDKITEAQDNANKKVDEARKLFDSTYGNIPPEIKSLIQDQEDLLAQYKLMPEATEEQIQAKNKLIEATENEIRRLKELGTTNAVRQRELKREADEKAKAAEELRKTSVELQQEIDAATVAAMQEGARRKLAELDNEYQKRKDTIAEKLREIEQLEKTTGTPATGQRNLLADLLLAETAKYKAERTAIEAESKQEIDAVFADVNERFNSQLDNQLNRINAYYAEQLQTVRDNVTKEADLQRLSLELEEKRVKELAIAREEYNLDTLSFEEEIALKRQEFANDELRWETDKQRKLLEIQINFALRRLRALNNIAISGGDAQEEIEKLRAEIERLNRELNKTDAGKIKEITDVLQSSLNSIASTLSGMPGSLGKIGEAMSSVVRNAENLKTIIDKTGESWSEMSSASKADVITSGVNGLLELFGLVGNQIAENKELQDEWNDKLTEAAHQAALARIELQAYQEGNIFGIENPYQKAIDGANEYAAAIEEIQKMSGLLAQGQVQTGTTKKVSGKNVIAGAGSGATVGAAVGSIIPGLGTAVGAVVGSVVGGIVGLFAKKTVPVFESLAKQYGEIFDPDTLELNPAILADYEKLDEDTKKLVDNWQEIKEKAKEAEQQMRDTFESLAGDIGTQLSDALVSAFRNNSLSSAMNDFEDGVTAIIENIVAQMVFATFFKDALDELQKGMEDSFAQGGDQNIIDDILKFTQDYTSAIPEFNEAMKTWRDELAKQGIDVFQPDETTRTATSKGIAQASQDTVDELNGRITNIQQMIFDIRSNGASSLQVNNELLNHQKLIKSQLDTIAENSAYLKKLERIDRSLDDINLKGVKIKQ